MPRRKLPENRWLTWLEHHKSYLSHSISDFRSDLDLVIKLAKYEHWKFVPLTKLLHFLKCVKDRGVLKREIG